MKKWIDSKKEQMLKCSLALYFRWVTLCFTTMFSASLKLWHHILPYWRRQWHPTPVLLPGKSHGQKARRKSRGRLQSIGWLRVGHDWATSLSLSCIGEGDGNPLWCSCLGNSRDGGAWWAAVHGVAQSWTWLKWLSSILPYKVMRH